MNARMVLGIAIGILPFGIAFFFGLRRDRDITLLTAGILLVVMAWALLIGWLTAG